MRKLVSGLGAAALLGVASPSPISAAPDDTLGMALLAADVDLFGNLIRGSGATAASRPTTGEYLVTFERDISQCFYSAVVSFDNDTPATPTNLQANLKAGNSNAVRVLVRDPSGTINGRPFHLIVFCPR